MKSQQSIQYALMCLRELDSRDDAASPVDISRKQGVPLTDCLRVLERLQAAGLLSTTPDGRFALPRALSELTAMEVVQAVATPVHKEPRFKLLAGGKEPWVIRMTLRAIAWAERHGIYLSDSGR